MLRLSLIFTFLRVSVKCAVFDKTTSTLSLPQSMYELCPYFTDCYSENASVIAAPKGYRPCCEQCSCRPDCGLTNNCCRDDLDKTNSLRNQTCTPSIVNLTTGIPYQPLNYLMIHDCPAESGISCKETTVFPWGPMYPVTSPSTKQTFLNRMCAACHNVTDVVDWDVSFVCSNHEDYDDSNLPVIDQIKDILSYRTKCTIEFSPSETIADIALACNPSIIRTCNVSGLTTHVSSELQELCESFNSTYTRMANGVKHSVFANVYCFMCNIKTDFTFHQCLIGDEDQKTFTENSFLSLMKGELLFTFFQSAARDAINNEFPEPTICGLLNDAENECRPVLCPDGRIRQDKTGCIYFSKAWLSESFSFIVKLVYARTDEPLIKATCFYSQYLNDWNDYIKLKIPGLNNWTKTLYYHPVLGSSEVEYFVVKLSLLQTAIVPEAEMENIETTMAKTWTITTCKSEHTFRVIFNEHLSYSGRRGVNLPNQLVSINAYVPIFAVFDDVIEKHDTEFLIDVTYYGDRINTRTGLILSRSFFCDQITLRGNEYTDLRDRLYIKKFGMYLEDGQFQRVVKPDGVTAIRVCLDTVSTNQATYFMRKDVIAVSIIAAVSVSFSITLFIANKHC